VNTITEMCRSALLGAAIGDALGVPHEFKKSADIPMHNQIQMLMPKEYKKTYPEIPYGTWSDDTSQMLCLVKSLLIGNGVLDLQVFANELLNWRFHGDNQAGSVVFDCGLATNAALHRLKQGAPPKSCGGTDTRNNGNGSLMRVLPAAFLPLIWNKSYTEALDVAVNQSLVTHGHAIAKACCLTYASLALEMISSPEDDIQNLVNVAFKHSIDWASDDRDLISAIAEVRRFGQEELPTGSGYVVDTFWSAIWSMEHGNNLVECLQLAISLGNDTDTTACVTGGLAGIRHGLESVPTSWWNSLRDFHLIPRLES